MGTEMETLTPTRNDFLGALSRIYWLIRPEDKAVAHDDLLLIERVGKRADELRAQLAAAQAERETWVQALDELHVVNWIGVIDGLSPRDAVRKLLEGALDQERDQLRSQLTESEAIVARLREELQSVWEAARREVFDEAVAACPPRQVVPPDGWKAYYADGYNRARRDYEDAIKAQRDTPPERAGTHN